MSRTGTPLRSSATSSDKESEITTTGTAPASGVAGIPRAMLTPDNTYRQAGPSGSYGVPTGFEPPNNAYIMYPHPPGGHQYHPMPQYPVHPPSQHTTEYYSTPGSGQDLPSGHFQPPAGYSYPTGPPFSPVYQGAGHQAAVQSPSRMGSDLQCSNSPFGSDSRTPSSASGSVTGDREEEINHLMQVCFRVVTSEYPFTDIPNRKSRN
jgi:hypothetical protein